MNSFCVEQTKPSII